MTLLSPKRGKRQVGRPAITCIDQLCRDTECLPNDLPALLQDRDGWNDRLVDARDSSTWWWWWWWWWYEMDLDLDTGKVNTFLFNFLLHPPPPPSPLHWSPTGINPPQGPSPYPLSFCYPFDTFLIGKMFRFLRGSLSKNRPLNFAWKIILPETHLASGRLYRDYN